MAHSDHLTRSTTDIWHIGQPIEAVKTSVFPSKREALALFIYYKINSKQTVHEALIFTAKGVRQL